MHLDEMYSKPEIDKIYTVQELAELFGCTSNTIRNVSNRLNIPHTYTTRNKARIAIYPYGSLRLFKAHFDARSKVLKDAAAKRLELAKEIETDGAENHPLVTDKRFLKLSYFPDVVPDCFKESEECTN